MRSKEKASAFNQVVDAKELAEDTGFEPADAFTSTVFKTAALNHSANPPCFNIIHDLKQIIKQKAQTNLKI